MAAETGNRPTYIFKTMTALKFQRQICGLGLQPWRARASKKPSASDCHSGRQPEVTRLAPKRL